MTAGLARSRVRLTALVVPVGLLCTGCSYYRSSLATSSGPTAPQSLWSVAPEQWAHVGEQIKFSYVLFGGAADYAILEIEPTDIHKVSIASEPTHFWFEDKDLRFDRLTPPKQPLVIRATAYHQRDARDHMDMNGQLLSRQSPYDVPDAKVASAQLKLHVYQSQVSLRLPADPAGYNWDTGKLLLYAEPDEPATIRVEKAFRKGFKVVGPNETGEFIITYAPTAQQVRRTGQTQVAFTVLNAAAAEHRIDMAIDTP